MIKRFAAVLALIIFHGACLFAQQGIPGSFNSREPQVKYSLDSVGKMYEDKTPAIKKPSKDFFMMSLGYNNWLSKPDSVNVKPVGYAFSTYVCYDFPIKKSNFSFATGIGINAQVVYLNQQRLANTDTGALGAQARFIPDTMHYKRYKFVTTYLQAPFELRYFSNMENRNRGFKAAIGLQVGTLLGSHTKGIRAIAGTNVKEKVDTKRYVSPWNFAATARVGVGNFFIYGSYNITTVFKETSGPPITPFSIGFTVTGL